MKKHSLPILFLAALVASLLFFTSCGGGGETETDTETQESPESAVENNEPKSDGSANTATENLNAEDSLGEFDFGGYEFKMLTKYTGSALHDYIDVEEQTGDILNDEIYERNRLIEESFNINFTEVLDNPVTDKARKSILSEDNAYDLITNRIPDVFIFAQQGLVVGIDDVPNVDLTKDYWHRSVNSDITIAGKQYFASGAFNLVTYDNTTLLLFNKTLVEELALPDIYGLVNSGEWTLDKFAEFAMAARKDVDGNGIFDTADRHGYLDTMRGILPSFWMASGVKSIYKDENDIPYFATMDSKFVDVYDKIMDCVFVNEAWHKLPSPDIQSDPININMFKGNQALFMGSSFARVSELRDMEIDFGIIPFPKYNNAQGQYYNRLSWLELSCIPVTADAESVARAGVIIESLACESLKTVIPAYYDVVLKTKYARDEESEQMIDIIMASNLFDLGDNVWSETLRDGEFRRLADTAGRDLISSMQSVENKINKQIANMVAAFTDAS